MVSPGYFARFFVRFFTSSEYAGILRHRWDFPNNTALTILAYLTYLSTLCFNLGEIISYVWEPEWILVFYVVGYLRKSRMFSHPSLATCSLVFPGLTHDHWEQASIVLDLHVGNVTVTVSDKTRRSARLLPDTVENLSEFFRSAERSATVYLGGQYRSNYF